MTFKCQIQQPKAKPNDHQHTYAPSLPHRVVDSSRIMLADGPSAQKDGGVASSCDPS